MIDFGRDEIYLLLHTHARMIRPRSTGITSQKLLQHVQLGSGLLGGIKVAGGKIQ